MKTAQEIKNGMTQGEWTIDPGKWGGYEFGVINKDRYVGGSFTAGGCNQHFPEESARNAEAIVRAINSTFGNNIDPEKVPEMYKMLDSVCAKLDLIQCESKDDLLRIKLCDIITEMTAIYKQATLK